MKSFDESSDSSRDDFLRLSLLGHAVHESRFWWMGGLIAGLLLACLFCRLEEPRYGMEMLVRIGQAGRKVLEVPYVAVKRVQSPDFRQGVVASLPAQVAARAGWQAAVVRDTNIIRVHVTGRQADVRVVATAVLGQLVARHNEMLGPMAAAMRRLLATPACQADRMVLPSRDTGADAVDGAAILTLSQQDGYGLPCAMELSMQITYPNTRATALLEPMAAQPEPESRLGRIALLGMVAGALLGFILFYGYRFLRFPSRQ